MQFVIPLFVELICLCSFIFLKILSIKTLTFCLLKSSKTAILLKNGTFSPYFGKKMQENLYYYKLFCNFVGFWCACAYAYYTCT